MIVQHEKISMEDENREGEKDGKKDLGASGNKG